MTTETTTPSLSAINPLIAYETWDEDTATNVRGALGFIADALAEMPPSMLNKETTYGASRLIMCCIAAMEVTKS
ncbi:MAG: hypothetical protein ABTQ26_11875 [Azonexus sp.]